MLEESKRKSGRERKELKMKNLICNNQGDIFYATIKKDGKMSEKGRVNLTKDATICTVIHLMMSEEWKNNDGFSGYTYETVTGGKVTLAAFDESKYLIVRRPDAEDPVEELGNAVPLSSEKTEDETSEA